MPISGLRRPIHFTPVPLKLNVARAAASTLNAIEPPLHPPGDPVKFWVQTLRYETAVVVSSIRIVPLVLLATVTTTAVDVVVLPAASRARAVSVCEALLAVVVSQTTE